MNSAVLFSSILNEFRLVHDFSDAYFDFPYILFLSRMIDRTGFHPFGRLRASFCTIWVPINAYVIYDEKIAVSRDSIFFSTVILSGVCSTRIVDDAGRTNGVEGSQAVKSRK
jgi:hypothetical protein